MIRVITSKSYMVGYFFDIRNRDLKEIKGEINIKINYLKDFKYH